ncbi:f-box only protein 7 [Caerostris darwini]|uniref:F-box only protein 7 n=1 Tax=Caerostris darwini TaxID=1538125 RepID=A0AAV4RA55_9ARAC|nr:f-box only protein 7 [Caerostris darwini]
MNENKINCEETIFPNEFLQLFSATKIENVNEGLIVLLHSYLLEVGFVPKNIDSDVSSCMPKNWTDSGIFKILYSHVNSPDKLCWITWTPIYNFMNIHATVEDSDSSDFVILTLKLSTFLNTDEDVSNPQNLFHNVKDLSIIFKDKLCYSLLALLEEGKPSFGFGGLIDELKLFILKMLPLKAVVSMSSVNKDFYDCANSSYLWKHLFRKDFGPASCFLMMIDEENWKEKYKEAYVSVRVRQRIRSIPLHHPYPYPEMMIPIPTNMEVLRIDMDPAIQQNFPLLRSRFRQPAFIPGGYEIYRRFW